MKIHKVTEAVAWVTQTSGRTQVEASFKFGVSQGAISNKRREEEFAKINCEKIPDKVKMARAYLDANPLGTWRGVAIHCGTDEPGAKQLCIVVMANMAREIYPLQNVAHRVDTTSAQQQGVERGRQLAKQECAQLARLVGGEHGESIAQAIEAL